MKKISSFCLMLTLSASAAFSQAQIEKRSDIATDSKNEIGVELGGTGMLYNIFYQKKLVRLSAKTTLNLRLGGAFDPFRFLSGSSATNYNVNLMPNVLFFKNRHAWEAGVALNFFDMTNYNAQVGDFNGNYSKADITDRLLMVVPQMSYRYYLGRGKVYLRGSVMANLQVKRWSYSWLQEGQAFIVPWAGVAAGVKF